MRFSVVIPTFRRPELLAETLDSVYACDPTPHEVIIVDADPESSALRVVEERQPGADEPVPKYLRSEPNVTIQRNKGIEAADGDIVVFLDDDVELDWSSFGALERAYRDGDVVGATGHVLEPRAHRRGGVDSPIRTFLFGGGRKGTFTRFGYPRYLEETAAEQDVEFMQGCFMTARLELASELRFDEHLPGYALAEDEDFSYRLSRHGRIRYLPEIEVLHKKTGFRSQDSRRFGCLVVTNRWYLFRKNFRQTPLAVAQFALFVALLIGHRLINREWQGALGLLQGVATVLRGRA